MTSKESPAPAPLLPSFLESASQGAVESFISSLLADSLSPILDSPSAGSQSLIWNRPRNVDLGRPNGLEIKHDDSVYGHNGLGLDFEVVHAVPKTATGSRTGSPFSPAEAAWTSSPQTVASTRAHTWVSKEARPISLRQLMVFGRSLNEQRLVSSANYVRTELPRRLAHRIRDMQTLPYCVVANPHFNEVYELYYEAFDRFRRVPEVRSLEDNDSFCEVISNMLKKHLSVIPKLAMGILETSADEMLPAKELDGFMNAILRSRISRRVIAEQHLSLTETFHSSTITPAVSPSDSEFIGKVFLKCNAADVIQRCGRAVLALARSAYGDDVALPEIKLSGHLDANFPFILSHMEYIIGELLRNSVQSVIEQQLRLGKPTGATTLPPIEVTICESSKHVVIRVSDQGGGIPRDVLPYLWSFVKGPHSQRILSNLTQVPMMAATLQEVRVDEPAENDGGKPRRGTRSPSTDYVSSLSSLTSRPPNLRLGMGLPLSRIYAEYWAGSLEAQSLWGYGVDVFFQVSKLGNKNEQLLTRAMMDAV